MNYKETELVVSILNDLIERYCNKHPEDHNFDLEGVGFDPHTLEIMGNNGDNLKSVLSWVFEEVIPDLL